MNRNAQAKSEDKDMPYETKSQTGSVKLNYLSKLKQKKANFRFNEDL